MKAFVENFKGTKLRNVHLDNLCNANEARKVFGGLAFEILQQYMSNSRNPARSRATQKSLWNLFITDTIGRCP